MIRKSLVIIGGLAALAVPVFAQSGAPDTLAALLTEVRQLRIAMERAATTAPQVQLLAARLTVQNDRLSRATRDHDDVQQEIDRTTAALAQLAARAQEIETASSAQTTPETQRQLAMEQRALKQEVEAQTAQETRLRAREAELANVLAAEQNRWSELNARLDEIERALSRPPR